MRRVGSRRSSAAHRGRLAASARAGATRVAEHGRRTHCSSRSRRIGKNLVLPFRGRRRRALASADDGPLVRATARAERRAAAPWLVLRGERVEGVLWNGPVLELHTRALRRLGPDILAQPPQLDAMLARLRAADATRWLGESLLDQSLVAGIGNMWLAEVAVGGAALAVARLARRRRGRSPRARSRRRPRLMRASVDGGRVGSAGLPPRRPAVPALPDADPRRGGRATTTG